MYPRRSRFSPEIRPGTARQQLSMTIWACVLIGSAVVMLGAFLLAGNFGVRQLVCSLIGSGAAVVFGICLLSLLPMLVRTMRAQLDQPGNAGPAIKTFFCIAMIALVATACTVMGGGAFAEGYEDARTDTKDEFAQPTSPYYALYQACVVRPFTTSIVVDVYPRSGIIKAIREA